MSAGVADLRAEKQTDKFWAVFFKFLGGEDSSRFVQQGLPKSPHATSIC